MLIVAGGHSAEHKISLVSAWNICNNLKHSTFQLNLIAVDQNGDWFLQDIPEFLKQKDDPKTIDLKRVNKVMLQPGHSKNKFYINDQSRFLELVDVVFPVVHGPNGEDGTLQGLLSQLQIPFIGPGVLGSAICMDKVVAKQLFDQNHIPTSRFVSFHCNDVGYSYEELEQKLGLPLFVKPANMGSSVGISKVTNKDEFEKALLLAFKHDQKVIVEEFVDGIEVECAVLGNQELKVSVPGTYRHHDDFFDFDTKYIDTQDVTMQIPALDLTEAEQREVMELSLRAYKACCCVGMARVDTFFTKDRQFFVNEINTLPGFTKNSMYPLLMEHGGLSYEQLIDSLCDLAIVQFNQSENNE